MKKNDLLSLLTPVALVLLGIVLFFVPDTGSILLSRILGWAVSLAGVAALLWAVFARQWGKLLAGLGLLGLGSFLLRNPLALAAFAGRIVGVLIVIRGIRDILQSSSGAGKLLAGVVTLVGVVLVLMPMSASRILFSGCGIALLVCGGGMLLQRIRQIRYLPKRRDDIIDAL